MRKTLKEIFTDSNYDQKWKTRNDDFIPDTWQSVVDKYENGYAEGIKGIQKGIDSYKEHKSTTEIIDVCGSEIIVDDFLRGIPECFIDVLPSEHGTIDLYFDITQLALHDCNIWRENMGTLLGIIEDIEHKGTRVELHAISNINAWDDSVGHKENMQKVELIIDIEKNCLSDVAILSHPSFIRRIVYSAIANYLNYKDLNGSKITVTSVPGQGPGQQPGVLIPDMFQQFYNDADREEYLTSWLKKT